MLQSNSSPLNSKHAVRPMGPENGPSLRSAKWEIEDTGWLITLCDLMFLFLGFLIVWYVLSTKATSGGQVNARQERLSPRASLSNVPAAKISSVSDWTAITNEITDYIDELGLEDGVRVEASTTEILLSLKDTVPFAPGRAELTQQVQPILEKLTSILLGRSDLLVEVSGHTDSLPIATTEFPSNWELSAARASRVARYLIDRGVYSSRVSVQGYADHRPLAPNTTAEERAANRRVEIRLYREKHGPVTQ